MIKGKKTKKTLYSISFMYLGGYQRMKKGNLSITALDIKI